MKKLLLISPEYTKAYTGVGNYVRKLAAKLSETMHVDVITTAGTKEISYSENENLFIYKIIKDWGIFGIIKIMNFTKRKNYDFINIQYVPHMYGWNGVNFSLFAFYPLLWLKRQNVFTYCHEVVLPFSLKDWHRFPFAVFNRLVYIFIVLFSKKVGLSIRNWKDASARIFFWLKNKFLLIPVFSNIKMISLSEAEKQNLRRKLNINEDETILFFLGGLHFSKLIGYVLFTLSYLLEKGYKTKLICAGFQTEMVYNYLKHSLSHLKNKIIITGFVSEESLPQLLNVADIYLCPYIDGVSTRRGSAMAGFQFGLPVVTTYGENTDMQLFFEKKCLLLSKLVMEKFAQKTEQLLINPQTRKEIGNAGREFYEDNFSLAVVVDCYLNKFLS